MRRLFHACFMLCFMLAPPAEAKVLDGTAQLAGTTLHYKVVVPDNYDPSKAYPTVLAFPPGPQSESMVPNILKRNFQEQAEKRGYVVIMPGTPDGSLFFEAADRVFPAFLDKIMADYKVLGGKLHIAGVSNGGISAFHIAGKYPKYFQSVTVFPGYLPEDENAPNLKGMCISMYVGDLDTGWRDDMKAQAEKFRSMGRKVKFSIEHGESHVMGTLAGAGSARLFDDMEEVKKGCP